MSIRFRCRFLELTILGVAFHVGAFEVIAAAQIPSPQMRSLPIPPIPADPLEMAASGVQPTQTAEQRAAAVALLTKARNLSNIRAQPYDLKTSFISSGGPPSDGNWTMQDTSPSRGIYRWTAQGPTYSAVNLYTATTQGTLYSNQPGSNVPLRLEQVREAIFYVYRLLGPQAVLRTANGFLNGSAVQCVLVSWGFRTESLSAGRSWNEAEYCVDARTGLLTTYSPIPGLYIHYDYTNPVAFHGKTIPSGFTITEAGRPVIEAKTLSVIDPPDATSSFFSPAGLTSSGVGMEMRGATNFRNFVWLTKQPRSTTDIAMQVVIVHGNVSPEGHLSETEVLASTDNSLNQIALERANQRNGTLPNNQAQPGATPQSHETYFTFEFATSGQ